ncbi:hypothetical protein PS15m_006375 [Mucor circinelloides]
MKQSLAIMVILSGRYRWNRLRYWAHLCFIEFEKVNNIYDFQLTRFVAQVREKMTRGNLTARQQKFVQYYENCKRRAVPNARTPFLFFSMNGCQRCFTNRYRLLH